MKFKVKDVEYVVSENAWNFCEQFEYKNKKNGKKYYSTVKDFDFNVMSGLIQL
jgi:hypothetical protein